MRTQLQRPVQSANSAQTLNGARSDHASLCDHLGGLGAVDTGVLPLQQDLKQRDLAVSLAVALINQRKSELDKVIDSLAKP